jgi:hypothetical protein
MYHVMDIPPSLSLIAENGSLVDLLLSTPYLSALVSRIDAVCGGLWRRA